MRVLEGRAAGTLADRLTGLPGRRDLGHAGEDVVRIGSGALEQRAGEDQLMLGRRRGIAIAVFQILDREDHPLALPGDGVGLHQHVLDLGPVATGVHGQRAADRTRHAGQELKIRELRLRCKSRHLSVKGARAGVDSVLIHPAHVGERLAEADDHALHPAVADEKIGADADCRHRNRRVKGAQEGLKVRLISGKEQDVRRTSDTQPSIGRQTFVADKFSCDLRQLVAPAHVRSFW